MNQKVNANRQITLSLDSKNYQIDYTSEISEYMPLDDDILQELAQSQ